MVSRFELRLVLVACGAIIAPGMGGAGCSSQTEVDALSVRISELESELKGDEGAKGADAEEASAAKDDDTEVASAAKPTETQVDEEGIDGLLAGEEDDDDSVLDLQEQEGGPGGCEGNDAVALGIARPDVTGPAGSVNDAEWLTADRAESCASPERCRLTCPEGARLVQKKRAHYCTLKGRKQGPSVTWYDSGMLKDRGDYLAGRKHGSWTAWHPNGRRAGMATHDAKNRDFPPSFVSMVETFAEVQLVTTSGQRVLAREYSDSSQLEGLSRHWNTQEGYITEVAFNAGKREGPTRVYDSDRVLVAEQMFKAGVAHGHRRGWDADGWMTLDMTYDNGVPEGRRRLWSGECRLRQVDHWKRGKLDGELSAWHSYPGQLRERSHFKAGERDGLSETWTFSGMLLRKHEHVAGKRHGESSGWHHNSQRAFETYWSRGRQDKAVRAWHPSGAPAVIGEYAAGRRLSLGCYGADGKRHSCSEIKQGVWDEW